MIVRLWISFNHYLAALTCRFFIQCAIDWFKTIEDWQY